MIENIREKCLLFTMSGFMTRFKQRFSWVSIIMAPVYATFYIVSFLLLICISLYMVLHTCFYDIRSEHRTNRHH